MTIELNIRSTLNYWRNNIETGNRLLIVTTWKRSYSVQKNKKHERDKDRKIARHSVIVVLQIHLVTSSHETKCFVVISWNCMDGHMHESNSLNPLEIWYNLRMTSFTLVREFSSIASQSLNTSQNLTLYLILRMNDFRWSVTIVS